MPRIAHFHGITVYMYYADHAPPHVHAFYGGRQATVEIASGVILEGGLPAPQMRRALEWITDRRRDLEHAWNLASNQIPPPSIPYP